VNRRQLVVGERSVGLLEIEITDQPGDPRLLVEEAAVILIGAGMNRLPALAPGRTFLCCQDQVVILQESLDPAVALPPEALWGGDQVGGDALEVRLHAGERAGRGRRLRLSIEILVQGRNGSGS